MKPSIKIILPISIIISTLLLTCVLISILLLTNVFITSYNFVDKNVKNSITPETTTENSISSKTVSRITTSTSPLDDNQYTFARIDEQYNKIEKSPKAPDTSLNNSIIELDEQDHEIEQSPKAPDKNLNNSNVDLEKQDREIEQSPKAPDKSLNNSNVDLEKQDREIEQSPKAPDKSLNNSNVNLEKQDRKIEKSPNTILNKNTTENVNQSNLDTQGKTYNLPNATAQVEKLIARYAKAYKLPETLVRRVVLRESGGNPRLKNRYYWGLMQISYPTAQSMGYKGEAKGLLDAETNLRYAVKYLAGAYLVADGDEAKAIRLYARGFYNEAKAKGVLEHTGLRPGPLSIITAYTNE